MDNYIVLEAKRSINNSKKAGLFDIVKLLTLVESTEYNYKLGYFIDIPTGDNLKDFTSFKIIEHYLNNKVFLIN